MLAFTILVPILLALDAVFSTPFGGSLCLLMICLLLPSQDHSTLGQIAAVASNTMAVQLTKVFPLGGITQALHALALIRTYQRKSPESPARLAATAAVIGCALIFNHEVLVLCSLSLFALSGIPSQFVADVSRNLNRPPVRRLAKPTRVDPGTQIDPPSLQQLPAVKNVAPASPTTALVPFSPVPNILNQLRTSPDKCLTPPKPYVRADPEAEPEPEAIPALAEEAPVEGPEPPADLDQPAEPVQDTALAPASLPLSADDIPAPFSSPTEPVQDTALVPASLFSPAEPVPDTALAPAPLSVALLLPTEEVPVALPSPAEPVQDTALVPASPPISVEQVAEPETPAPSTPIQYRSDRPEIPEEEEEEVIQTFESAKETLRGLVLEQLEYSPALQGESPEMAELTELFGSLKISETEAVATADPLEFDISPELLQSIDEFVAEFGGAEVQVGVDADSTANVDNMNVDFNFNLDLGFDLTGLDFSLDSTAELPELSELPSLDNYTVEDLEAALALELGEAYDPAPAPAQVSGEMEVDRPAPAPAPNQPPPPPTPTVSVSFAAPTAPTFSFSAPFVRPESIFVPVPVFSSGLFGAPASAPTSSAALSGPSVPEPGSVPALFGPVSAPSPAAAPSLFAPASPASEPAPVSSPALSGPPVSVSAPASGLVPGHDGPAPDPSPEPSLLAPGPSNIAPAPSTPEPAPASSAVPPSAPVSGPSASVPPAPSASALAQAPASSSTFFGPPVSAPAIVPVPTLFGPTSGPSPTASAEFSFFAPGPSLSAPAPPAPAVPVSSAPQLPAASTFSFSAPFVPPMVRPAPAPAQFVPEPAPASTPAPAFFGSAPGPSSAAAAARVSSPALSGAIASVPAYVPAPAPATSAPAPVSSPWPGLSPAPRSTPVPSPSPTTRRINQDTDAPPLSSVPAAFILKTTPKKPDYIIMPKDEGAAKDRGEKGKGKEKEEKMEDWGKQEGEEKERTKKKILIKRPPAPKVPSCLVPRKPKPKPKS
ncbi:hypothetical protein F4818DRAFT_457974 [Hypoxylon cercidicola]|nr:hypothetical protein F4818DRAFT_457974 [Hypoxylon cercidicola]